MVLSVEELDLKVNCSFDKMLLLVKCCSSLVNINFSKKLEKEGNEDIDLQLVIMCLSPFLQLVFISEYLRRSGKIPEDNDLVHMLVNGELIKVELCFIIFTEISSYLYELENFKDLINFLFHVCLYSYIQSVGTVF